MASCPGNREPRRHARAGAEGKAKRRSLPWFAAGPLLAGPPAALTISWADSTSAGTDTLSGQPTVGSTTVAVTFTGSSSFAQTAGGIDFRNPAPPHLSATVPNAPRDPEIIALGAGGTGTITLSQATDGCPILALVGWTRSTADFRTGIEMLGPGTGYRGTGSFTACCSALGRTGLAGARRARRG